MAFLDLAVIASAALASTLAAVLLIARQQSAGRQPAQATSAEPSPVMSLVFQDDHLKQISDAAFRQFHLEPGKHRWADMCHRLSNRFPDLPVRSSDARPGEMTLAARGCDDVASLCLCRDGNLTRVDFYAESQADTSDSRFKTIMQELEDLRRASDTTTHAIWQVDEQGQVRWFNEAYRLLYLRLHGTEPVAEKSVFCAVETFDPNKERQRLSFTPAADLPADWYDVSAVKAADITIYHAVDVNAVVKSEVAQRNFVQTLAKTFAQLSIGLAIFDRNGQLALFNPALIDLTALPADFLSSRPTLMSFFDRIRENRRMPEPKNYQSWRQKITDLVAAATDGRYQETWTLESGQTYRVNGRPHPDGAIAFLIEDISAEVSLTRNFRAELEIGQSMMDSFEDALVVFSSTGMLAFSNRAYREMWGMDPENSFAEITVADCVAGWKGASRDGSDWDAVTNFALDFGEKTSWEMTATLLCGKALTCSVSRIASGATIVRFKASAQLSPAAYRNGHDRHPH